MELLKKAESNNDFGLRLRFPWSGTEQQSPWTTVVIDPTEEAFAMGKVGNVGSIVKRVENPYLWARYQLRYEELKANDDSVVGVTEKIVIHATNHDNAMRIADANFDWRLVSRALFGHGVSFATTAAYANKYAGNKGTYIVAGIIVGRVGIGSRFTEIPCIDYDTTRCPKDLVYVKYCDDDFYPYYIVG